MVISKRKRTLAGVWVCLAALMVAKSIFAADLIGVWTKETLADPENLVIIYQELSEIKALGYAEISGAKAVWYASGEFKGYPLRLVYHYAGAAVPPGWMQDGVMLLDISGDGKVLSGTATSAEGNWSGPVRFRRVR